MQTYEGGHTYIHTRIHTRTHTYVRTYARTHAYIHTYPESRVGVHSCRMPGEEESTAASFLCKFYRVKNVKPLNFSGSCFSTVTVTAVTYPTHIPMSPCSQPGMTCRAPRVNAMGSLPAWRELSNTAPLFSLPCKTM